MSTFEQPSPKLTSSNEIQSPAYMYPTLPELPLASMLSRFEELGTLLPVKSSHCIVPSLMV